MSLVTYYIDECHSCDRLLMVTPETTQDEKEARGLWVKAEVAQELLNALERMIARYRTDGGESLLPEFQAALAAIVNATAITKNTP